MRSGRPARGPIPQIVAARYDLPTDRYDHAVLGDALEWGGLRLTLSDGQEQHFVLPRTHVFEDLAPRLADLDGDGAPEVIVVETDRARGAALAVWDATGRRAATPPIGQSHRWLAPLGAADLDGDGRVEIAYVDRPHLARILRIVRLEGTRLVPVADHTGLTNHRIGDAFLSGGVRHCPDSIPELVAVRPGWDRLVGARMDQSGQMVLRDLGPYSDTALAAALACHQ